MKTKELSARASLSLGAGDAFQRCITLIDLKAQHYSLPIVTFNEDHSMPNRPSPSFVAIPATADVPNTAKGDNLKILLQYLSNRMVMNGENPRDYFISVSSQKLEKLCGSRYKLVIDQAVSDGLVERNSTYSTGRVNRPPFTKSYRLAKDHRHGRSKIVPIVGAHARRRMATAYEPDPKNLKESGMHLVGHSKSFNLNDAALDSSTIGKHENRCAVARYANQQEFAKRCKNGRHHSLNTQLPARERRHLSVTRPNGCKTGVALVDVSSCQPLLLAALVAHNQRTGTPEVPLYVPRFCDLTGGWMNEVSPSIRDWISLCESGQLYLELRKITLSMEGPLTVPIELTNGRWINIDLRKKSARTFKRAVLVPIFDRIDAMLQNPIFHAIKELCPPIADYVLAAKSQHGYKAVANYCQRLESTLMVDNVIGHFMREHKQEPVQTIHDALMVSEEFEDEAKNVIRHEFESIGLKPKIKSEFPGRSCSNQPDRP
ncbi:hypothetical protein [Aporhodopirellula aestuarii]|uniref:Uncharacterized protein n=1 Tax=Aporhodopirellula aestuarii TaxID=2950107 RepID=A0ABT0U3Q5_9BACT|nr:hypothetical protein [Aporhodopirellula aestuarii]MCM2371093.1 hypothetical protein [Aporhodopirellula aestuarii]